MRFLLVGLLIGFIFGIPIGTIGTMVVQNTLNYSMKEGILTGLGSSVADTLYAIIGAFGLNILSEALIQNEVLISIIGGNFLLVMGVSIFRKPIEPVISENKKVNKATFFLPAFFIGITNPVAILTFIFAFTYFQIPEVMHVLESILLVLGVFISTLTWWVILSVIIQYAKNNNVFNRLSNKNKWFGATYVILGISVLVRSIRH